MGLVLQTVLLFAVVAYLLIGLAMFFGQRRLMYVPDAERTAPVALGLAGVEEHLIKTADGETVVAWYARAKPGQPTILYFHGNAGSLATRVERVRNYVSRGRGMFIMSYRGYSGSSGNPTEAANISDAKRAYDALVALGVRAEDIIIYGESLGSGVALQVVAEKAAAGVILDAPYTSLVDVAAEHYSWLPVRTMMVDRYESTRFIGALTAPLFIVHGEQDDVVPVHMGREILRLAKAPKEMVTFPEAGHADHSLFGSYEAINGWIDRLRAAQSPAKATGAAPPAN
jgi:fermentation-respiration switch protein FrsA (DUF1100 family)